MTDGNPLSAAAAAVKALHAAKTIKRITTMWKIWAKALGQKASENDREADMVAIIRTIIAAVYLITNCVIIAGVVKHWNQ